MGSDNVGVEVPDVDLESFGLHVSRLVEVELAEATIVSPDRLVGEVEAERLPVRLPAEDAGLKDEGVAGDTAAAAHRAMDRLGQLVWRAARIVPPGRDQP